MINFLCGQSRCGVVRNQERVYQAYEMSVSKKRVHTNEQCFILLLEMDNASLCCKKGTTFLELLLKRTLKF